MIYINLIIEFFKIGLFSFGGGYATIPFLYHISETFKWYTFEELTQMIALASITPGPIGINVATYAGLKTGGILGAILATISEMLPSLIIILIILKLLIKFKDNYYILSAIETLKPIGCALLASVAIKLLIPEIKNPYSIILLLLLLILSIKGKKSPIFYILISAIFSISISFIQ